MDSEAPLETGINCPALILLFAINVGESVGDSINVGSCFALNQGDYENDHLICRFAFS